VLSHAGTRWTLRVSAVRRLVQQLRSPWMGSRRYVDMTEYSLSLSSVELPYAKINSEILRCRTFTPSALYVSNVAKRSIWEQCKKYTDDDRRPTNDLTFGKIQVAISPQGVVRSTSCLFYGGVFEVGGSNGAISGFAKSKMAAQLPSWKNQMAISPRRIIQFTPCLLLTWGFRGRRIEWR